MKTLVILGPTCCWKSQVAIALAEQLNAEIISCDSMQVYQGLEIGTAQPTAEQQAKIKHHLIGMMPISAKYDVNQFIALAKGKLAELQKRGSPAIIVGGTGLYAKSLIYGHSLMPADKELADKYQTLVLSPDGRCELEALVIAAAGSKENVPLDILLNPRHLARAAEVLRLTGKLPWQLQNAQAMPSPDYSQFILLPQLDYLRQRIQLRTQKMIADGWIQEAQRAIGDGLMTSPTARQALGYREIDEFLSGNGEVKSEQELTSLLAMKTAQFARRQLTWFKHQHPGANFINVADDSNTASIANEIMHCIK